MQHLDALAIRYDGRLRLLDQTRLPDEEVWIDASDPAAMIEAIRALRVRGAPLIGVAAALCVGHHGGEAPERLREIARAIRAARPTAVNLMWAIDRLLRVIDADGDVAAEAHAIYAEDVALCHAMSEHGAALVAPGENLLTHCNTGGLATAGCGTALGVIAAAHRQGKGVHVWVDETRPLLQGGRLTAWELGRLGIPHTLITDSMAPVLMRDSRVQRVFVGSDRVAANGDFANKIGTYGVAVAARHHGVPFHPVAPWSTVDLACPTGRDIPIEERDPSEVRGARAVRWAPSDVPAWNPAFDVTPVELVTSLVLDTGVYDRDALRAGALAASRPVDGDRPPR